jgi:hypothetical protein
MITMICPKRCSNLALLEHTVDVQIVATVTPRSIARLNRARARGARGRGGARRGMGKRYYDPPSTAEVMDNIRGRQ